MEYIYSLFYSSEVDIIPIDDLEIVVDVRTKDQKTIDMLNQELINSRLELLRQNKDFTKKLNDSADVIDKLNHDVTTTNMNYEITKSKYCDLLQKNKTMIFKYNNDKC